jgi:hypothetical protein
MYILTNRQGILYITGAGYHEPVHNVGMYGFGLTGRRLVGAYAHHVRGHERVRVDAIGFENPFGPEKAPVPRVWRSEYDISVAKTRRISSLSVFYRSDTIYFANLDAGMIWKGDTPSVCTAFYANWDRPLFNPSVYAETRCGKIVHVPFSNLDDVLCAELDWYLCAVHPLSSSLCCSEDSGLLYSANRSLYARDIRSPRASRVGTRDDFSAMFCVDGVLYAVDDTRTLCIYDERNDAVVGAGWHIPADASVVAPIGCRV